MAGPKYCRTLYVSLTLNSLTLCIVVKCLKKLNGYFLLISIDGYIPTELIQLKVSIIILKTTF